MREIFLKFLPIATNFSIVQLQVADIQHIKMLKFIGVSYQADV